MAALAGAAIASIACGSASTQDATSGLDRPMTPPTGMITETTTTTPTSTSAAASTEPHRLDEAKLAAFVVGFRTQFPELAREREDSSIETIAVRSCEDIAHGFEEQRIATEIRSLASHDGTEPNETDVRRIYEILSPVCP
ncbi:hypothetical protein [Rhodococcus qingshengii]|uniref:hypothetical protein n=1 Tax=Rhodococcus TaxID=1827 RepID=UPI001BB031F5|nr:hypothetical protein [Rhodococcus qingshengii]MBS3695707.1 hypothetical protein [Rhodococcus qingshengii]